MTMRSLAPTMLLSLVAWLNLCPHTAQAQSAAQRCAKESGDAAIAACNDAIKQKPSAPLYYNRGIEWGLKGDTERAIADYDAAIRLNPKYAKAYYNRGNAWKNKGDYDKAISDYNLAIKFDPKDADAYNNRGNAWLDKGDYDKAIADYNVAIRFDPNDAEAYNNRGNAWFNKGDYDKAIGDFNAAIKLKPDYQVAVDNLKLALKQNEEASRVVPESESMTQTPEPPLSMQSPNAVRSGKRVALIIGNAKYMHSPILKNPPQDAQLLASTLRKVGFESVIVKSDLTREGMIQALREFAPVADSADWSLIYFSGHGISVGGENYLIPVDAKILTDRDVELETVNMTQILNTAERARRLRVVILDACRDNPLASQMRRTMATRSLSRGLSRIEPEAGTLVAFAAKHGETALDGTGNNSPFLEAFVRRLQENPPIEIRRLFDFVRDDVLEATNKQQQPFKYDSLSAREDFFFVK